MEGANNPPLWEQEVTGGKDPPSLSLMTSRQPKASAQLNRGALRTTPGHANGHGQSHRATLRGTQAGNGQPSPNPGRV